MSKIFAVKTIKEGQHDIFNIEGDVMDDTSSIIRIYRMEDDDHVLIASFQDWVYGLELPPQKKAPE